MPNQSRPQASAASWRVAAVVVTVLANVAVVWLAVDRTLSTSPAAPSGAALSRPAATSEPATSAPGTADSSPEEPTTKDGSPVDVLVDVTPGASGFVDMIEQVRPNAAVSWLDLQTPPSLGGDLGRPRVLGLAVMIDGTRASVTPASRGRWRIPLPHGASEVILSYRLTDVTERRSAAPEGRVLLQVRPLTTASAATATAVLRIVGVTVHNLVCPDRPLADQLCGRVDGDQWQTAPVPMDESTVVAQIDLPTTGA